MNGSNNFEDMITKLTQNPEALKSLMGVASSIMGDQPKPPNSQEKCPYEKNEHCECSEPREMCNRVDTTPKPHRKRGDDAENLICLLIALKPYVSDGRCEKIDSIIKILKLVQLSEKTGLLKSLL